MSDKYLIFMTGGSGSGKGVAKKNLKTLRVLTGDELMLSGKDLMGGHPDYIAMKDTHRHPEKTPALIGDYYRLLKEQADGAMKEGRSIIVDDHLDNTELMRQLLADAKQQGYSTVLLGFSASPEAAFDVYDTLARESGKNADYEWMISSYKQFARTFEQFAPEFDLSTLFYRELGQPGRAVFMRDANDPTPDMIDKGSYERFQQWQHARTDAKTAADVLAGTQPEAGPALDGTIERSDTGRAARAEPSPDASFAQRIKQALAGCEIKLER